MKQIILGLLLLLWCCGFCAAQQVVSSGGHTEGSDISFNWILGGDLSFISNNDVFTSYSDFLFESKISLKLYPNPASDLFNVEITPVDTGQFVFELYNSLGKKVFNKKYSLIPVIQVSISHLPPGAYIFKAFSSQNEMLFGTMTVFKY